MEWNREILKAYIEKYKENLPQIRADEAYKWKAVRHFQDHWDIEAEDFWRMLKESLGKTGNLLAAYMFYPGNYIVRLAEKDPEAVREMFRRLYDEAGSVEMRIDEFCSRAAVVRDRYFEGDKNHYQNTNAVTTYLSLRFPEEYYIYKYTECKSCADKLGCNMVIFQSGKGESALAAFEFYDEIRRVLASDQELVEMSRDCLGAECYKEETLRMLTADMVFFISRYQETPEANEEAFQSWMRSQVRPNGERQYTDNTINAYTRSLNLVHTRIDTAPVKSLFEIDDLEMLSRMDSRIRHAPNFTEANKALSNGALSTALKLYGDFLEQRKSLQGDQTDLSTAPDSAQRGEAGQVAGRKGANAMNIGMNTILYGPPGTGKTYSTVLYAVAVIEEKTLEDIEKIPYKEVFERYRKYRDEGLIEFCTFHQSYGYEEFIEGIRPIAPEEEQYGGDKGIRYRVTPGIFRKFCEDAEEAAVGKREELGIGENPTIWKISLQGTGENPIRTDCMNNNHIRIGWAGYGSDLSKESDYVDGGKSVLNAFVNVMQIGDLVMSCYSENEIDAVGVVTGDYEWVGTYSGYNRQRAVRWLAKGFKEDIRAINGGRKLTLSTVYRLNQMALSDVLNIVQKHQKDQSADTRNRVFIIDEINRGNISRIFGELITLIEPTKRLNGDEEIRVKLPYSGRKFGIPQNVYLLGTMNTADRSIALIDTALRRRFRFVEMQPKPELLSGTVVEGIRIGGLLMAVNRRVEVLYDREHTIGHAFFMELKDHPDQDGLERLAVIFEYSVIPLLQEYFYEDYEKIRLVLGDNRTEDQGLQFIVKQPDNYGDFGGAEYNFDVGNAYRVNRDALRNAAAYRKIYE